jgi:hypothetical protein
MLDRQRARRPIVPKNATALPQLRPAARKSPGETPVPDPLRRPTVKAFAPGLRAPAA